MFPISFSSWILSFECVGILYVGMSTVIYVPWWIWTLIVRLGRKNYTTLPPINVTKLGDFWKLLATNFRSNVAQIFVDNLGNFEKPHWSKSFYWILRCKLQTTVLSIAFALWLGIIWQGDPSTFQHVLKAVFIDVVNVNQFGPTICLVSLMLCFLFNIWSQANLSWEGSRFFEGIYY